MCILGKYNGRRIMGKWSRNRVCCINDIVRVELEVLLSGCSCFVSIGRAKLCQTFIEK